MRGLENSQSLRRRSPKDSAQQQQCTPSVPARPSKMEGEIPAVKQITGDSIVAQVDLGDSGRGKCSATSSPFGAGADLNINRANPSSGAVPVFKGLENSKLLQ